MNHPSDESLCALSLGQLTEAELAHVSAHLADCPECCCRIDQLATNDPLLALVQQSDASREKALVKPAQRRAAVRALRRVEGGECSVEGEQDPPLSTHHTPPSQIGDYDILGEVGRGGMGVVYKARHRSLHRLAALKMVLAGQFASATQELRFRLEAELAARVQHPNIVQVYEIGSYEGRPFLALEWVEGGSLANRLDGKPWPPSEAAALIETLARAIDVAHSQGVIHRDLKPANILLQKDEFGKMKEEGESSRFGFLLSSSSLVPKITDFGLAQTIEGGQTMTQSGFLVGTPGYMAPEQAGGKRALVGPATDIYALGVVLYQLLTGQLPFQADSTLDLLRAVTSDEPPRPRRLQPGVPRDLEAITLHCLEKEPASRYPSALALAEDLRRFQERRQVVARPVGAVARLGRACRRRPLVTTLVALLTVSLFGGMSGVTWKWLEANEQRDRADTHARQADAEKQAALFQAYRASLAAAGPALQNHDVADAARHLESAPEALRGWEWWHLRSCLDDSAWVVPLPASRPGVADGFLVAAHDWFRIAVVTSAGLHITDPEGREHGTVPLGPDRRVRVNATQTRLGLRVAAWVDNTAFDLLDDAGRVLCRVVRPDNEGADSAPVAISPDGTRLACWSGNTRKHVVVFDATSGKQTAVCKSHDDVSTYTFNSDGARLATGSIDRTACVWDAASGNLLTTCQGHTGTVTSATFSPDGARLVTASADGTVRQWDTQTGEAVEPPYSGHTREVYCAVYSPDGQCVASVGQDRTIRVWRAQGRQEVAVLHGHTGRIFEVKFGPGGRRVASRSTHLPDVVGDDTVRVWNVDPRTTLPVLRGHTAAIYPLAYSPDGRWLASGSEDRTVRLWDPETAELCATLPHPSSVQGLAFGPDNTWLVTGCAQDGSLRIWDVATARVLQKIPFHRRNFHFHSLTLSPDGRRVATTVQDHASHNHHLTVWDIASGESIFSTKGLALAYSPDGRWLAVRTADEKTVLLLDARTHETAARYSGHENTVYKAAFSPDSRSLASCSLDCTVRLWQIDALTLPSSPAEEGEGRVRGCRVLRGHTDEVIAVAFHPDGTRLATGGRDGVIWLWDLARGEEVARLRGHQGFVWSLAFSSDGTTLASGSGDATVRLWDMVLRKTRYKARRDAFALQPEAERLVEQLGREKKDLAEVVRAIRADRGASEDLRHAALRAVLRQAQSAQAAPDNPHDPP